MNDLGLDLMWLAAQVTVLCSVALAVMAVVGRKSQTNLTTSWISVVLILVLTLMSFSTWPRWSWVSWLATESTATSTSSSATASNGSESRTLLGPDGKANRDSTFHTNPADAGNRTELAATPSTLVGLPWAGWVAWIAGGLVLTGLVRLFAGWCVIHACIKNCRTISDRATREIVAILSAELGCARSVSLIVSDDVQSPATFGWWRPVILLPADWKLCLADPRPTTSYRSSNANPVLVPLVARIPPGKECLCVSAEILF
ncbi:MAG: M56 family metallopeptidase [Planctomycetota bacterium]